MPGARWFPGSKLNYAEHMLGGDGDADRIAVVARSQTRPPVELTFGELREQVARARAGLQRLGVGPGDRVAAYLPNIPETLVAFIATASLGAIWATCAPEFGARSVVDRFGQIEPRVLLAVGGYGFRDRVRRPPRRGRDDPVSAARLERVVGVPVRCSPARRRAQRGMSWSSEPGPLEFDPVPFEHPLYVLFSSGTTGLPKAIVHGHGGQLIEHHKNHGLMLGPQARCPAAVVLDDGVDDVERAGSGCCSGVDRDARRRPAGRIALAVAAGRELRADRDGGSRRI